MTGIRRSRIAVLASGDGSNLAALLASLDARGDAGRADVVGVASDRAAAGALARAADRGLPTALLATAARPERAPLGAVLDGWGADLVVLAGYLRLVPDDVVRAYHGRILNIHPALLPAFGGPGMFGSRVHQAVLAAGAHLSGATVHFVDDVFDHGAIAAQWPVPVLGSDDPATLAARVLRVEHALYPHVVHALAAGELSLVDGHARWEVPPPAGDPAFALRLIARGERDDLPMQLAERYPPLPSTLQRP